MEQRYMRRPYDFVEQWRDQGGLGVLDVAFWRPVCEPGKLTNYLQALFSVQVFHVMFNCRSFSRIFQTGFHTVGDIAYACDWCGWPKPGSYLSKLMCISDEMLRDCTFKPTPLWTNDGGWENQQGSVWEIDEGMSPSPQFWRGNDGWGSMPNLGRAYCLKEGEGDFEPL